MEIKIDEGAMKDLSKLDKNIALNILDKIELLKNYPYTPNIKKLTNFNPKFRYRVGDYRILFDIESRALTIYRVLHRKKAYD